MNVQSEVVFEKLSADLGHDFSGEIKVGGNYRPFVRDGDSVFVSGQVPRVGDRVVVTGRAGSTASLDDARLAAKICTMRALALLRQAAGGLDRVRQVLRLGVFIQCTEDFTLHSEVADAASEVLYAVLGEAGVHARTSVGVYQLPKNATVELELLAAVD